MRANEWQHKWFKNCRFIFCHAWFSSSKFCILRCVEVFRLLLAQETAILDSMKINCAVIYAMGGASSYTCNYYLRMLAILQFSLMCHYIIVTFLRIRSQMHRTLMLGLNMDSCFCLASYVWSTHSDSSMQWDQILE